MGNPDPSVSSASPELLAAGALFCLATSAAVPHNSYIDGCPLSLKDGPYARDRLSRFCAGYGSGPCRAKLGAPDVQVGRGQAAAVRTAAFEACCQPLSLQVPCEHGFA